MGALESHVCRSCGYVATVSGGYSLMMRAQTRTVSCATCRELTDVIVRSDELGNFPPPENGGEHGLPEVPLRCHEGDSHEVALWERGGPCPRCGEAMESHGIFALTD